MHYKIRLETDMGKHFKYAFVTAASVLTGLALGACTAAAISSRLPEKDKAIDSVAAAYTSRVSVSQKNLEDATANPAQENALKMDNPPKSSIDLEVEKYIAQNSKSLKRFLEKTARFESYISKAAAENNIEKSLIYGIIAVESNGDPYKISRAGAAGLMQVMPGTAKYLGIAQSTHPSSVIKASGYLAQQIDRFGLELGLAAYNCGPTRMRKLVNRHGSDWDAVKNHLPKETRKYVAKVLAAMRVAEDLI